MKNKNGRRRRIAMQKAACMEDRLSKLPNDLLLNILERLDTADALRTCILSKQMLNLPAMLSHFFISFDSIMSHHNIDSSFTWGQLMRNNRAVTHITDNILRTRSPEISIRKLSVRFILKNHDCLSIGKSVARAMAAQKVDTAEFEIRTEKSWHICTHADFLHHAKQFNSFLGACPDAFAGLRSLWLFNMRFGELDMPIILGTCKRLESLHLTRCYSGIHSVLQVEHAQLVELEIGEGKFERIELTCLPKLQQIWVLPECPEPLTPLLSKLQRVNLDNLPEGCDWSWTKFILEAAPSLKELCITVWDHWCNMVTNTEFRKANGYCEKED